MTGQTDSQDYKRGLELADAGRYQEALACLREHLRATPDDPQALNDAGAVLHCLGRTDEAIASLDEARRLQPDSGEILWNLAEACLGGGRAVDAAALFDEMEQMKLMNVDVLNRTATALLNQGRKALAIEVLLRSLRLWPEQEVLRPMLDVIRSKRPKVAFFCGGGGRDGALADVCEFVSRRFRTEFHGRPHADAMTELMLGSDVCWLDGHGDMIVAASRQHVPCRIVVSLRRSEVRESWTRRVQWENVDILAQIGGSAVEEALLEQVPDLRNRTRLVVIPSGVDTILDTSERPET